MIKVLARVVVIFLAFVALARWSHTVGVQEPILYVFFMALWEEFVFRKLWIDYFSKKPRFTLTLLLGVLLFATLHMTRYGFGWEIAYIFVDAIALSAVYVATRSLMLCTTIHALSNFTIKTNMHVVLLGECTSDIGITCVQFGGLVVLIESILTFFIAVVFLRALFAGHKQPDNEASL